MRASRLMSSASGWFIEEASGGGSIRPARSLLKGPPPLTSPAPCSDTNLSNLSDLPRSPRSPVPELRKDPITGRWVIYSAERAARPHDLPGAPDPPSEEGCPFCEGHEAETPPEIYAVRDYGTAANSPGWRVRVV